MTPEEVLGRPVVLVHGTRTSSAIWSGQAAALAAHGHPVHAIDLPGHGTRSGERLTRRGALEAIDAAVRGCEVPPLLVGLSLGGYLCLAYAAAGGDHLAGVVLAGCSTQLRGKPLRAYRELSRYVTRTFGLGGGTWHVVTDMLTTLAGYSPLDDLRRLTVPVWVVNGRRDPLRFDEWRYRRAVPGLRVHVVPGAGHDVNSEHPVAFNRLLLDVVHGLRPVAVPPPDVPGGTRPDDGARP
ncbi:alpha/beta fold hydrolase [Cellulomonas marina]|uniref:Pimeloyl-ACP methyl ester carboxylesterase n=1 Tax=Cellulomonas marina TaxID=988821 RepID=A0A1I0ZRV3_9CELL|nr:alpha/beta fold hydrolase [Cellulomonas marina]GIG28837.1 lysophospholipase [Cellulomonas marina]SFB27846.1 Pimeloyl-ACP methyl ester carboxylesterase [Cellulomonas marina]